MACRRLMPPRAMSRMTLTKRFQAIHSITPGEQIRQVKLQNAKRLLKQSAQSVAEIAMGIGFTDQSKFGKFFKRESGGTASALRRASKWHP